MVNAIRRTTGLAAVAMLAAGVADVSAQAQPSVAGLVPALVKDAAVLAPGDSGNHSQHFVPGDDVLQPLYALNRLLAFQVASAPLGPGALASSRPTAEGSRIPVSGGWADSVRTLGRGYLGVALAYQATTFDSVDDIDLRSSQINLYIPHQVATGEASDRDMMAQTVSLRLNRKVSLFSLTYGWEDRFDVGVVVPFVQVAADARVTSYVARVASSNNPAVHEFDSIGLGNRSLPRYCSELEQGFDPDRLQCHGSRTARGFGDILLRGKYRVAGTDGGVAIGADISLPTGDADNFIGLGALQVRPSVSWSGTYGRITPRLRVEYAWSEGELSGDLGPGVDRDVPDEYGLAFGVDASLTRRLTLAFDVAGRQFDGLPELRRETLTLDGHGPASAPGAPFIGDNALVAGASRSVTQVSTAIGLRATLPGSLLAQVSVLVPVSTDGLRPGPAAMFSLTRSY